MRICQINVEGTSKTSDGEWCGSSTFANLMLKELAKLLKEHWGGSQTLFSQKPVPTVAQDLAYKFQ